MRGRHGLVPAIDKTPDYLARPSIAPKTQAGIFDVPSLMQHKVSYIDALPAIRAVSGKTRFAIAREYAIFALGAGKISFADYIKLRLFDDKFWYGAEKREIIGDKRGRELYIEANWRHDWLGLPSNKVASFAYLDAYGLPTIPSKAIYAPQLTGRNPAILRTHEALERFLLSPDVYPLFGKPIEGMRSFGSIALHACLPDSHEALSYDGRRIDIDALIHEITKQFGGGYVFQPFISPHPDIARFCGARLATVRMLTIACEDGPRVFRVAWKIPAGSNVADNYWRAGNLLAQLDIKDGRVLRVTSGSGLTMREHMDHPDTDLRLVGFDFPDWEAMKVLALEGAYLMRHVPMIGWDIACTESGPRIVEMNWSPDAFLMQFSSRTGLLDQEFGSFLAFQRKNRIRFESRMRAQFKI